MQLSTERLVLREFATDDWRVVFDYQCDALYLRYYPWENRTEEDVRAFVAKFIDQSAQPRRVAYQLAAVLSSEGTLIGNCGLRVEDSAARRANIGYELGSRYWGNGYGIEMAREMARFGFEELGMQVLSAECIAENVGSVRILEKLGMRQVQRLAAKERFKGRVWDVVRYEIGRDDWKSWKS